MNYISIDLLKTTIKNIKFSTLEYSGKKFPMINELKIFDPEKIEKIPVYRVLDEHGKIIGKIDTPNDIAKNIYISMVRTRVFYYIYLLDYG